MVTKTMTLSEARAAFQAAIQGLTLAMAKAGSAGRCTREKLIPFKLPGGHEVKAPCITIGRIKAVKFAFTFKREGSKWAGVDFKPVEAMLLPSPLVFTVACQAGVNLLEALDAAGDYLTPYIDTYKLAAKASDSKEYGLNVEVTIEEVTRKRF